MENNICQMVEDWVDRLCRFVVDKGGMRRSLIALRECNDDHKEQCSVTSRGAPKCHVAKCMLKSNRLHSLLFLGVQESNFKILCKCLVDVASKRTSTHVKNYLQRLSETME
ncbi:hypothetical protein GGI13_005675 [Coemansia sp. RSA 455]|nr:hypothetical protein GGI13_005675 [Coemansia sp. RSA 455]